MPESDQALVARCRSGDEDAWDTLIERYARYVHAITVQAFRLAPEDAEDVFQDVFLRAFEHLDSLRDDGALKPWIAQVTRRCCLDRVRTGGREQPSETVEEVEDSEDMIAQLDEALAVHGALEGLSPECREVLDRFFCRDESYRTIGKVLELPSGTIASRISRCLAKLRQQLEGRKPSIGSSSIRVTR